MTKPSLRPRGVTLKSDERLLGISEVVVSKPERVLSTLRAMMGLTAVDHSRLIGTNGPSNASNALKKETLTADSEQGKYDVFFPRDAHVVADILAADRFLPLTRSTVLASLEQMGVVDNFRHSQGLLDEQEVGKIPHEIRQPDDPIARDLSERKDWGWPYYGAVDTTGKNVRAIARYVSDSDEGADFLAAQFTGRDGEQRTVEQGLKMNLDWLLNRCDLNPEGLLESLSKNPKHHANQSWADSPESFHHADGSWAAHHPEQNWGVAALDVQAETYAALRAAAGLYSQTEDAAFAAQLTHQAERLRAAVLEHFWVDDPQHFGGFFGRGTDRDATGKLRVLAIRTSDMGVLLDSGLLDDDPNDAALTADMKMKREAVVANLMSPEMLCPSGIRTLSADSVRYSPDRYHNGASWPWTTYYAARGMERYGFQEQAAVLKQRVLESYAETGLLGEYFSGDESPDRLLVDQKVEVENLSLTTDPRYAVSQAAQEVQAWTAATLLAMKLENDPLRRVVRDA